jgi:hypothetical protein
MGYWIQDTGYMGYRIHSINKYMWFRYDIDNICVYIDIYVPTSGTYRAHSTYNYKTLPWIRYRYCGIFYICSYSHISTLGLLYFSVSPSIGYFTCLSVCLYVCMFVCLYVCMFVCLSLCLFVCFSYEEKILCLSSHGESILKFENWAEYPVPCLYSPSTHCHEYIQMKNPFTARYCS